MGGLKIFHLAGFWIGKELFKYSEGRLKIVFSGGEFFNGAQQLDFNKNVLPQFRRKIILWEFRPRVDQIWSPKFRLDPEPDFIFA